MKKGIVDFLSDITCFIKKLTPLLKRRCYVRIFPETYFSKEKSKIARINEAFRLIFNASNSFRSSREE